MPKKKLPIQERDYRAAIPVGPHPWRVFEAALREYGWYVTRDDETPPTPEKE